MLNKAKAYFKKNREDILDFVYGVGIWGVLIALIFAANYLGGINPAV